MNTPQKIDITINDLIDTIIRSKAKKPETIKKHLDQDKIRGKLATIFGQDYLNRTIETIKSDSKDKLKEKTDDDGDLYYDEDDVIRQIESDIEKIRYTTRPTGIRPTLDQLRDYVNKAISHRAWDLLDKILSLSEEGELEPKAVQKMALDNIIDGDDDSYVLFTNKFGEVDFTKDVVIPIYDELIEEENYIKLQRIKTETGIPVPQDSCQEKYEEIVLDDKFSKIDELFSASGVQPELTKTMKNNIIQRLKKQGFQGKICENRWRNIEAEEDEISSLENYFEISKQTRFIRKLQETALSNDYIDNFLRLYNITTHKISETVLNDGYKRLSEEYEKDKAIDEDESQGNEEKQEIKRDRLEEILRIIKTTKTIKTKKIAHKIYNKLLKEQRYKEIELLQKDINIKPKFDKQTIEHRLMQLCDSSIHRRDKFNMNKFLSFADMVTETGFEIPRTYIDQACFNHLDHKGRAFESIEKVNKVYKKFNLEPHESVNSYKIMCLMWELDSKIKRKETEYSKKEYQRKISPLEPINRFNTTMYNKYKTSVNSLVKKYIKEMSQIDKTKINKKVFEQHNHEMQKVYERCLELLIVQASKNEQSLVKVDKLEKQTGIKIKDRTISDAIRKFIEKNYRNIENPENIIKTINTRTDINIDLEQPFYYIPGMKANDTLTDKIGGHLITVQQYHEERTDLGEKLNYLLAFANKDKFSEKTQAEIRKKMIEYLENGQTKKYDNLIPFLSKKIRFNKQEKQTLEQKAIEFIKNSSWEYGGLNRLKRFDCIASRANIKPKIQQQELNELIKQYFDKSNSNNAPTDISKRFNLVPDEKQIKDRYVYLLEKKEKYDWPDKWYVNDATKQVEKLRKDTGVKLDRDYIKIFIQTWLNKQDYYRAKEYIKLFTESFDFRYSEQELQRLYNGNDNYEIVNLLLNTHKIPPNKEKAEEIIKKVYKSERAYGRDLVKSITHDHKIQTPDEITDNIKESITFYLEKREIINLIPIAYELHNIYNKSDIVSKQQAEQIISEIGYLFQKRTEDITRSSLNALDISYIYEKANAQDKAIDFATQLFKTAFDKELYKNNIYRGYVFCAITGAKPDLDQEKLAELKHDAQLSGKYQYTFGAEQRQEYIEMLDKWVSGE